jgi:hypothetical protein
MSVKPYSFAASPTKVNCPALTITFGIGSQSDEGTPCVFRRLSKVIAVEFLQRFVLHMDLYALGLHKSRQRAQDRDAGSAGFRSQGRNETVQSVVRKMFEEGRIEDFR